MTLIMRHKLFLGICCVIGVLICCECLKRCGTDDYYDKGDNVCLPCPECFGGGIGYNESVIREEDEHGFMTCYPCQECAQGTYRPLNGPSSYCYKCMLDCVHANRYESVHCGGDTEGHCGDCITGHRPESSEPNSMCYPKEDEQLAVVSPVIVTTLRHDIKTEDINEDQPNADLVKGGSVKQYNERTVILIVVVSILSLIVISIAIWCLICYCPRSHNATGHDAETPIHSKANLINSSGGSIHTGFDDDLQKEKEPLSEKPIIISIYDETDLSVICLSTGKDEGLEVRKPLLESDNLPRDDLEVDCPGDSKVRGELPSRQLEDIDLPPVQFGKITREGLPPVGTITQEGLPPVGTITQEGLPPVQEEITNQKHVEKNNILWQRKNSPCLRLQIIQISIRVYHGQEKVVDICGNSTSDNMLKLGSDIRIVFQTNNDTEGRGFVIQYFMVEVSGEKRDDDDSHSRGYTNHWGSVLIIVFAIAVVGMFVTTILVCYCTRKRAKQEQKQEVYTVAYTSSNDDGDDNEYIDMKENDV